MPHFTNSLLTMFSFLCYVQQQTINVCFWKNLTHYLIHVNLSSKRCTALVMIWCHDVFILSCFRKENGYSFTTLFRLGNNVEFLIMVTHSICRSQNVSTHKLSRIIFAHTRKTLGDYIQKLFCVFACLSGESPVWSYICNKDTFSS